MTEQKNILIVLFGAIGDVTRALPLAVRIKEHWPNAAISWAVEPASHKLVAAHPAISKVFLFERGGGLPAYFKFIKELRQERFDIVLDLQRIFKSGFTSFLSRAPRRLGFSFKSSRELNWAFANEYIPDVQKLTSKIEHYQLFGDALELPKSEPLAFGIELGKEIVSKAEDILKSHSHAKGFVGFIIGSNWETKNWPVQKYIDLANTLFEQYGLVSVIVGGKNEQAAAQEIENAVGKDKIINAVLKTDLVEVCGLFSKMQCVVGSDTGPMHLAAAVGVPVISVWGATSPKRSAPYGASHVCLQSPIGCSPCYLRECPGLGMLCLASISVEVVTAAFERVRQIEQRRAFS